MGVSFFFLSGERNISKVSFFFTMVIECEEYRVNMIWEESFRCFMLVILSS